MVTSHRIKMSNQSNIQEIIETAVLAAIRTSSEEQTTPTNNRPPPGRPTSNNYVGGTGGRLVTDEVVTPTPRPRYYQQWQTPSCSRRRQGPVRKPKTKGSSKDIFCLPYEDKDVLTIPRGRYREMLARKGMTGKIRLTKEMSPQEVIEEVTSVFKKTFELGKQPLKFKILGTLPGGGKKLKQPSVSSHFRWGGAEVLSTIGQNCLYVMCDMQYGITYENFYEQTEDEMVIQPPSKKTRIISLVYLMGHLRSRGIRIQRARLRKALQAVDAAGVHRRRTRTITRRVYSVPCPNYLWHIDGTHKLIRWKFVIHAGIDGFSRLITYLRCSDNNTAETVLTLFESAVDRYGLPIRVRSDHGGENQDVWGKMLAERGEMNNPVIVGSSVHNERVERLNYDINNQVVAYFKCIFQDLEREDVLDPDNETDLFCLHYVFLPRINKHLHEFEACHNNHNISTEGNRTPIQLFYSNQHLIQLHENQPHTETISAQELLNLNLTYVNVYSVGCPLDCEQLDELERAYPHDSDMDAKEMYKSVAEYISEHLH